MKQIHREFDVIIGVPDDISAESCEIIVEPAASYINPAGQNIVVNAADIRVQSQDPEEV